MANQTGTKELTGRKVLLICVAAFGVILAANMTMLFAATGTFPGLVVKSPYVASQSWDARTAAQEALGWQASAAHADGRLAVRLAGPDGAPVEGVAVTATVGRPATQAEDRVVELAATGGLHEAALDLAPGVWRVEILGEAGDGRRFEAQVDLYVEAGS